MSTIASSILLLAGRSNRDGSNVAPAALRSFFSDNQTRVACIGAAFGDSPSRFARIEAMLREAGAVRVRAVSTVGVRDATSARKALAEAEVIFFGGGDVNAGMQTLDALELTATLRREAARGVRFAGTSAGAIMLGRFWVRWRNPNDDATASIFPCTGIAPLCCDTHGEEDEWEELRRLVSLLPQGEEGIGIPSGCGIVVDTNGNINPLGDVPVRFVSRSGAAIRIS